eukprot:TRINITY_DN5583_c0_g2_i1.p2 TRINITY_DN5583_c0_g2~~TRINITY_DN5583_c0_g2_i1.p2  ORF type:complete len:119 (-),score=12.16 TRINITY_DN5583_c0_g2_i1:180-536(-)
MSVTRGVSSFLMSWGVARNVEPVHSWTYVLSVRRESCDATNVEPSGNDRVNAKSWFSLTDCVTALIAPTLSKGSSLLHTPVSPHSKNIPNTTAVSPACTTAPDMNTTSLHTLTTSPVL